MQDRVPPPPAPAPRRGALAAAALRPACSVALAIAAAHALHLGDAWWAAISAFVVMDTAWRASLARGALRIGGTVAGGLIGFGAALFTGGHPLAYALLLAGAAWIGLFMALTRHASYAWVLAVVTFAMVMGEAPAPADVLWAFALERIANVVVGTLACLAVEGAWALWAGRGRTPAPPPGPVPTDADRRVAAEHALQGAIVIALVAAAMRWEPLGAFPQAMVSALAVLVVPLGADAAQTRPQVHIRMRLRVAGCAAAAALGAVVLPLLQVHVLAGLAVLLAGVWAGAWLQTARPAWRYGALQFVIALLMVFVPDHGLANHPRAALERLLGVALGVAVTWAVLAVWNAARRASPRRA